MRKHTIDMNTPKTDTELTKELIELFYAHSIPVLQVHPESKIPMWKKWQDITVESSRKAIDLSIKSNFGIVNGPIDDKTTVCTIDFDCFNKTIKSPMTSLSKRNSVKSSRELIMMVPMHQALVRTTACSSTPSTRK